MFDRLPILAACGWSGSGKTTLLTAVLERLRGRGLRVAIVKHSAHHLDGGASDKDSDRYFHAGADVLAVGVGETHRRRHRNDDDRWAGHLTALANEYDLVLVEGAKRLPTAKVWLLHKTRTDPPNDVTGVIETLPWAGNRIGAMMRILDGFLVDRWHRTPLLGCVLIGGRSERLGVPKHLLATDGVSWLARTVKLLGPMCEQVVVVGDGEIPPDADGFRHLPDVTDAGGPMSGLLAAMRWAPHASWLTAACDLPHLSSAALRWLLRTRAPGVWAALPRLPDSPGVEPLLAHYDFRARHLLEGLAATGQFGLWRLADDDRIATPAPPDDLTSAWRNINTKADLADFERDARP